MHVGGGRGGSPPPGTCFNFHSDGGWAPPVDHPPSPGPLLPWDPPPFQCIPGPSCASPSPVLRVGCHRDENTGVPSAGDASSLWGVLCAPPFMCQRCGGVRPLRPPDPRRSTPGRPSAVGSGAGHRPKGNGPAQTAAGERSGPRPGARQVPERVPQVAFRIPTLPPQPFPNLQRHAGTEGDQSQRPLALGAPGVARAAHNPYNPRDPQRRQRKAAARDRGGRGRPPTTAPLARAQATPHPQPPTGAEAMRTLFACRRVRQTCFVGSQQQVQLESPDRAARVLPKSVPAGWPAKGILAPFGPDPFGLPGV